MQTVHLDSAARDVLQVLPQRANDLARWQLLLAHDLPVITVLGKYNHGKSSLLNELMGREVFSVADRRETIRLSDYKQDGVRWLDAPGLDADVASQDDQHAMQAAWLHSDIRIFLHALKEGELDEQELALAVQLTADAQRSRRQTLLVLTQVDQMVDDAALAKVTHAIAAQLPGVQQHLVSATRHRKGREEGKQLLVQKSGVPALHAELNQALTRVADNRAFESAMLWSAIAADLQSLGVRQSQSLDGLCEIQSQQARAFTAGLDDVIRKVSADINAMLDALKTDHAVVPDKASDAYMLTAGKAERAHLQMGYSRVCIAMDAYLAGHGVKELPSAQATAAGSLNTVMIAVMGVSVKFRKDLRQIFGTDAGRERMQREFSRYYELSKDRRALAEQIERAKAALQTTQAALSAWSELEITA